MEAILVTCLIAAIMCASSMNGYLKFIMVSLLWQTCGGYLQITKLSEKCVSLANCRY